METGTRLLTESSLTSIGIVVFPVLTVLGSEVLLLQAPGRYSSAVCPARFLQLMSQVNAEKSVRRPLRYLCKCSSVLTMACSFGRVTSALFGALL
jgi:hypothetical protein